jgi:hypothetical protein
MLTNIKKRSALLLSLAVVCATVAIVPQTAGAAASKQPSATLTPVAPSVAEGMVACPGDSAPAAGFSDTTSTDVDCIKMFGITQGTTATTYEPDGTIPRWQMALFIHRMFTPTGVLAAGAVAVPAFTDTADLSAEIQAAITALASHGITLGTSATTFGPNDNVTREQMALFLDRFSIIAKDHAGAAITRNVASGAYNYTDIASTGFEAMESIINLFNIGVTEGYVTAAAASRSYRPSDNITRAEMASMITRLLNHSNARPAGITVQASTVGAALAPQATDVMISVRNADFTPSANTLVDEFYQNHADLLTAVAPFTVLGTVGTATSNSVGGVKGTIDNTDRTTSPLGNVAGTQRTTEANKTMNWWVHHGSSGTQYVDGTTSDFDKLSITHGAASTLVNAATATVTSDAGFAGVIDRSGLATAANNDGIATFAGGSRTFTVTLKGAANPTTDVVKDGYTIKVVTQAADHLGNVTQSTAYYPTTAGVATFTTTCPADDSALNLNYNHTFEHTLSVGTAAGGTGLPAGLNYAGGGDPFDTDGAGNNYGTTTWGTGVGGNASKAGVSCDDTARAYSGAETLAINDNAVTLSTAGTMASITATAYDQYGAGIANTPVRFGSVRTTAAGVATDNNAVANLTTGSNGTATLSAVVCATGELSVAWDVIDPGATNMDAIAASTPTNLVEGSTVYCNSAGTDVSLAPSAGTDCVILVTLSQTGSDDGSLKLIYGGQTFTGAHDGIGAAAVQAGLRGLSTLDNNVTVALAGAVYTITIPGKFVCSAMTSTGSDLHKNTGPVATTIAITQDGSGASALGTPLTGHKFLDENAGSDTFYTIRTLTTQNTDGAPLVTTTYHKWTYDSTDNWNSPAVNGMSEAQFETALAAVTDQNTNISLTYRTGALTTGISTFLVG